MAGPAQESDGSEPLGNKLSKDAPKEIGTAPSGRPTETPRPWKRKTRPQVFEGGTQWQRPAPTPDRILEPPIPVSTAQTFPAVMGVAGVLLTTATAAGVMGYLSGFRPSIESPQPDLAFDQSDIPQARRSPRANSEVSKISPERPATRPFAIASASVDAGRTANDWASAANTVRSLVPSAPGSRTVLPPTASRPPAPATGASEIVANAPPPARLVHPKPPIPRPG
jgi:hypothetical protein